jgi:hypothetical protein
MIRVTIVPIGWAGVNVKKSKHQRNRRRQFATMTLRNVVNYAAGNDEVVDPLVKIEKSKKEINKYGTS